MVAPEPACRDAVDHGVDEGEEAVRVEVAPLRNSAYNTKFRPACFDQITCIVNKKKETLYPKVVYHFAMASVTEYIQNFVESTVLTRIVA